MVDSSDTERIGISREEFHAILAEDELKDALILVYANKQVRPHRYLSNLLLIRCLDRHWLDGTLQSDFRFQSSQRAASSMYTARRFCHEPIWKSRCMRMGRVHNRGSSSNLHIQRMVSSKHQKALHCIQIKPVDIWIWRCSHQSFWPSVCSLWSCAQCG